MYNNFNCCGVTSLSVFLVNPCCSFPCENGGVCVDDGDEYTCDCTRTGYYGVDCEKRKKLQYCVGEFQL
jgi:hypothetical protein